MKLVIVESPTKAKALRGFLGSGYRVVASMGHIRDLPPKDLGVDVAHDFQPHYRLRAGGRKVLGQLRQAASGAAILYLATDPDREGEAIAWHVAQVLCRECQDKPVLRISFHEITPAAIHAALAAPGELDMDLVNAQQARRVLDRLVGYQVSPVLWRAIKGRKGLSAGRVQTVALRLVVERDRAIAAFVPEEYWTLDAEFSKVDDDRRFRARLVRIGKAKPDLRTQADAQAIIDDLAGADYRVLHVKQRTQPRRPYPPYITSTLQQDGSNRLGWPAAKTMRVAQQLYEGVTLPDEGTVGLITYMRTDSTFVAESAQQEAREVIERFWGHDYLPAAPPQYKTRAKVAQEAHEAIRPTSSWRLPRDLREHLTTDQARLYELIWRRFIASQMKPAVYHVTTVDIASARDGAD
ncbi:MAG: type I DNA topoisomerase, partial [Chloroflexi bacterium]|nr:type I DNA topoisomerase [Chloroflexota bacterium]